MKGSLKGLAFILDPDDREALLELLYDGVAKEHIAICHYPRLDGTDEPPQVVSRWGTSNEQVGHLIRFWLLLTGEDLRAPQNKAREG